ncbi:MAG: hypothetical protein WC694_02615 [Candidatus Paceibacterota bacterium]|jgi:hypothetical protein
MNPEELQRNIALYYSKLPPKVQEIFSSMKWLETLKQISLKYNLNNTQQETLGTETTLLLLGIIHLDEYQKNLWTELNLSEEFMDNIFKEINDSIINTIRPKLFEVFEKNVKSGISEKADWQQNINFILSGGDYSAFLTQNSPLEEYPLGGGGQILHPVASATPQEGNKDDTVLPVFFINK